MFSLSASRLLLQRKWRLLASQYRPVSFSTAGSGRVAVITGAAQGIGRGIALRPAHDGFDIALNDLPSSESKLRDVSALVAQAGRQAFIFTGDVSVTEDVERLVGSAVKSLGSVDVVRFEANPYPYNGLFSRA